MSLPNSQTGNQNPDAGEGNEDEEIVHTNDQSAANAQLAAQNQQLLGILADPDILRVYNAKKAGKPVTISDTPEPDPEPEPEDDLTAGLDDNDPSKKILETITKLIDTKLNKALEPLSGQLDSVRSVTEQVQRQEVTSQITKAQEKYKDFGEYKTKMLELSKENPSLAVEDLYILAKNRAGKLRMVEQVTTTERPTHQPNRSSKPGGKQPPPRPAGRKGFTDMLAESLAGLDTAGM